jgi:hypothetical protein
LHLQDKIHQSSNTAGLTPQQKTALTYANNRQQEHKANQAAAIAASMCRELIILFWPFVIGSLYILLVPRQAMTKAKDHAIWQNPTTGRSRGGALSSKQTLSHSVSPAPIVKKTKHSEF